jgi:hypothetical protein
MSRLELPRREELAKG